MSKSKITIGEKIDDLIKKNDLTSKELSKRVTAAGVKLSEATLSDIINNVDKGYSYKIFVEIAKQLNVSLDYLLTDSDIFTTDNKLKFVCEYTRLSENTINILCKLEPDSLKFVNDMVYFADENKYILSQFFFKKKLLLSYYERILKNIDPMGVFNEWKFGKNDETLASTQFRLQSAFNYYINDSDVIKMTRYLDKVEHRLAANLKKCSTEANAVNLIAKKYNFEDWYSWLCANKDDFNDAASLKKWLSEYNINISDITANQMLQMISYKFSNSPNILLEAINSESIKKTILQTNL